MSRILVYTFFGYHKSTSKVLYRFVDAEYPCEKLFIPGKFAVKRLLTMIASFDYIIGIGDHNKNAKKSRFDQKYTNRYGRRAILVDATENLDSNLSISLPPEDFYTYASTPNGPCNRSAYLIMNSIISNNFKTKFGFFHLQKENCEKDLRQILRCLS